MEMRRLTPDDVDAVLAAAHLFDDPPRREWTEQFLGRAGHHMVLAGVGGEPAGFISGVEITHPDKGTEMLLYELGVDEAFRLQGIGRSLTGALLDVARELGCRGMWVPVDPDDEAAIATYRSAGSGEPEAAAILAWEPLA